MFFKLIDKYTVKKAPRPLKTEGNDVFTNNEKSHNEQGYFRVVNTEYPEDEKAYRPIYKMDTGVILQTFEEVTQDEEEGATK